MKAKLVELLICPECRADLNLEVSTREGDEILAGKLRCSKCGVEFPIHNGIPRFVPSDAYLSSFSFEWMRWRSIQFDTEERQDTESIFKISTGRRPDELAGKLALDAGCGAGRYVDVVSRAGADVVGVDFSFSVDSARQNLRGLPNCHLVQADLLRLPFRAGTFDFIYSIGVLEHTPDTRRAFLSLAQALKPTGEIAIYLCTPRRRLTEIFQYFPGQVNEVLGRDVGFRIPARWNGLARRSAPLLDWVMETSADLQRSVTSRLPTRWVYWLCHAAIPLYYLYRIPLFYPLRLVTRIAMHPDPQRRVFDTFDWYSPHYKWRHSFTEVRMWFEEAGLQEISLLPRSVVVRGKKPASA